jgi:hypothetical protein
VNAIRTEHELRACQDDQTAARHRQLARIWRALEAKAATEADIFAATQETRRQWEAITEPTRRTAIAADLELRRRHPGQQIPPLRPHPSEADGIVGPANPGPSTGVDRQPERAGHTPTDRREADAELTLGLTMQAAHEQIPEQVLRIRQNAATAQATLDDLANLPLPGTDEDNLPPGLAWPAVAGRDRDAVLQPPRPDVVPSTRVVDRYHRAQPQAGQAEAEPG